jgi:hypothetical protein
MNGLYELPSKVIVSLATLIPEWSIGLSPMTILEKEG